jgi:hypothetical protein
MIDGKNKTIIIVAATFDHFIAIDSHFELFNRFLLPSTVVSIDKYLAIEN